jgi:hypothetical protein
MLRFLLFTLAALAVSSTGCSLLLMRTGTDIDLGSRDDVHRELGSPTSTNEEHGQHCEEYFTRRKIAESYSTTQLEAMSHFRTLFIFEPIVFPIEFYTAIKRSVVGQQIQFTYDADGKITSICRDGIMVRDTRPKAEE